jgi:hypothetical protein
VQSVCFKVVAIFYNWIFLHIPPEENDACEQNRNSRSECGCMLHYNASSMGKNSQCMRNNDMVQSANPAGDNMNGDELNGNLNFCYSSNSCP